MLQSYSIKIQYSGGAAGGGGGGGGGGGANFGAHADPSFTHFS